MIIDFIIIFLPGATGAWNHFPPGRPVPQPGARKQAVDGAKPFWGTHETRLKQSGRTHVRNKEAFPTLEAQMNHSLHSADRATHLKIVAVALIAGIAVAAFGITTRANVDYSQTAHVIKAGKPVVVTSSDTSTVR
jgi:hypothetical protein